MRKGITASELMTKLNANPEYVTKRAQEEEERQKRAAEWRRVETPLREELRAAGIVVESVWDLVNTDVPYSSALPILLGHLQRPYPAAIREGISRALAVPEASFAWDMLTQLYCNEQEVRAKDGLAVAISAIANDEVISDLIALVRDTQQGPSRLLLLRALERSSDPKAYVTLVELATDPDLSKEVQVILRRLPRAE